VLAIALMGEDEIENLLENNVKACN